MTYQVEVSRINSIGQMENILNEVEELALKLEENYFNCTGLNAYKNDVLTQKAIRYAVHNANFIFNGLYIKVDDFGRMELVN